MRTPEKKPRLHSAEEPQGPHNTFSLFRLDVIGWIKVIVLIAGIALLTLVALGVHIHPET